MIVAALLASLITFLLTGGVILLAFIWAFRKMLG